MDRQTMKTPMLTHDIFSWHQVIAESLVLSELKLFKLWFANLLLCNKLFFLFDVGENL